MLYLYSLPEEIIVEICQDMDTLTLRNFILVSKQSNRIGHKILKNKENKYKEIAAEISDVISDNKRKFIILTSTDKSRDLTLYYDSKYPKGYKIYERLNLNVFALQKLKLTPYDIRTDSYRHNKETIEVTIIRLLRHGYITGEYTLVD